MTKIFKQLGRHWAACLAVVALLIVQAYCDLSLPDYTSKIVDTGIQQGGIESPVPDTVRSTTLQALELLMSEDDAALADEAYDAIYCFNVLHLFRQHERSLFVQKCHQVLKKGGVAFFAVFSDQESSFGKGQQVEENTFESKPGRPVHYYTEPDLKRQFELFSILDAGIAEDREDHGSEGPHTHVVRYILVEK